MYYIELYNKLTLQQMIIFAEVADCQNITVAAERLNMTHSAVSKSIQNMEVSLELILFIRKKQRLLLTPAGKALFHDLKSILETLNESIQAAKRIQEARERPLLVGYPAGTNPNGYVLPIIHQYKHAHPYTDIQIESMPLDNLIHALINNKLDFVFTNSLAEKQAAIDGVCTYEILECPLMVYLTQTNPLAQSDETCLVEFSDLRSFRFLLSSSASFNPYSNSISELCEKHGFTPKTRSVIHNIESVCSNLLSENDVLIGNEFILNPNPNVTKRKIQNEKRSVLLHHRAIDRSEQIQSFVSEAISFGQDYDSTI